MLGLQVLQNWVEAKAAVWVAEFQQRGVWAGDGSRSVASWVEERIHTPAVRVAAQAQRKLGRALRHMRCDRPPSWCDVHHCQNWEHGGPTNSNNGALLCRHHHTFLHKNHWTIEVEPHNARTETGHTQT